MSEWFDDDELWKCVREAVFPPTSFASGPSEIAAVFSLASLSPGARLDVLDMPCGPGRHTLPLAQAGHRVVAVDRTQPYLDELAERVATRRVEQPARTLAVETVRADMRDFVRPGAFDLAINLYTSIGYFRDLDDDRRVLRNLHDSLRPGGRLVIDVMGREILARIWNPKGWHRLADGTIQLQERTITDGFRWIEVEWTFIKDGAERRFDFSHRVWGSADLAIELEAAGFSDLSLYGGFEGQPYDVAATRLVVVAQR